MKERIIIVHGWGGNPNEGWFPWAKKKLGEKGYKVMVPEMPDTNYPSIGKWVPYLTQVVGEVTKDDIFIGHSMGCQAILRFLEGLPKDQKIGKVILVAGFGPHLKGLKEEEQCIAQPWLDAMLDLDKIRAKANSFTAIFSDNDPFVPLEENKKLFEEKLGAKIIVLKNQGHFSGDDGIKSLPVLSELI